MRAINTRQINIAYARSLAERGGLKDYTFAAFDENGTTVLHVCRGKSEQYSFVGADIPNAVRALHTWRLGAPHDHPVLKASGEPVGIPNRERDVLHDVFKAVAEAASLAH